ncbi:MAG: YchJ family protein [Parashewanella sp.]
MMSSDLCPCNSKKLYRDCCQRLHKQQTIACSPEQLMRSRYCAFVKQEFEYIIDTHAPEFLNGLTVDQLNKPPLPQWLNLDVIDATMDNEQGTVTFKAWYKIGKKVDVIFEKSNFVRRNDHWFYTNGEHFETRLPERNEPCICLSGKKFKKCCGR